MVLSLLKILEILVLAYHFVEAFEVFIDSVGFPVVIAAAAAIIIVVAIIIIACVVRRKK
jgi:hypothetical protein